MQVVDADAAPWIGQAVDLVKQEFLRRYEEVNESLNCGVNADVRPSETLNWLRIEVRLERGKALSWVRAQANWCHQRFYLRNRDGSCDVGGIGFAAMYHGADALTRFPAGTHPRTYLCGRFDRSVSTGGFTDVTLDDVSSTRDSFNAQGDAEGQVDAHHSDGEWDAFGPSQLVFVPMLEVRSDESVALNVNCSDPRSWPRAQQLLQNVQTPSPLLSEEQDGSTLCGWQAPAGGTVVRGWSKDGYKTAVRAVKDALRAGVCSKVVLARSLRFSFEEPVSDAFSMLPGLDKLAPGGFLFALQPSEGRVFLGCSPERLFRLRGRGVDSEALAGTCRVDSDDEKDENEMGGAEENSEDSVRTGLVADDAKNKDHVRRRPPSMRRRRAEAKLLASLKDRYEQNIVSTYAREVLERVCEAGSVYEHSPHVLHQPHLAHLRTMLTARMPARPTPENVRILLNALHPTPAVCGTPTHSARELIGDIEPFDRGLYAGPFGYVDDGVAEFFVAIRSALMLRREVIVYAGAGIVPRSDPDKEWRETSLKMTPFVNLLIGPPGWLGTSDDSDSGEELNRALAGRSRNASRRGYPRDTVSVKLNGEGSPLSQEGEDEESTDVARKETVGGDMPEAKAETTSTRRIMSSS